MLGRLAAPTDQALIFRHGALVCCRTDTIRYADARLSTPPSIIRPGTTAMLETIIVVLLILWALGLVTSYSLGGFIHILLVIAIVVILIRVIQGRRI